MGQSSKVAVPPSGLRPTDLVRRPPAGREARVAGEELTPFADLIDCGLEVVADGVASAAASWWSAQVAVIRRGPGSVALVTRHSPFDKALFRLQDGWFDDVVRTGDEQPLTVVALGAGPFVLVVDAVVQDIVVSARAQELRCAELALRAANAEDQVRVLMQEVAAHHGVTAEILSLRDLDQVLLSIANEILVLLRADMAGVLLADDGELVMRCCVGNHDIETARLRMGRGRGLAGRVLETSEPCKVDAYLGSERITHDFDPLARSERTRSALGAPLTVHGEVIGVLEVWRRRRSPFAESDVDRLVALTNLAAIAIENARLYEQARDGLRQLAAAEDALSHQVHALQRAADIHLSFSGLLLSGEDVHAIARTAAHLLDAGVVILSRELCELARSPRDLDIALMRPEVAQLTERNPQGVTSAVLSGQPGWLTAHPVCAGSDVFGWVCILAGSPPSTLTEIVAGSAALHTALWHLRAAAAEDARAEIVEHIVWDLLDGPAEHRLAAAARASRRRIDLLRPHRVMVGAWEGLGRHAADHGWDTAEVERFRRSTRARLLRLVAERTGAELVGVRGDAVAAIIPDVGDLRDLLDRLEADMVQGNEPTLRWGVSAPRSDPTKLDSAHAEALGALRVAQRLGPRRVAVFDELGVVRFLVGPGDDGDLNRLANDLIGPLVDSDRSKNGDLVATLRGYLDANCSQREAAQRLFIHYKTMRYRLDRIQRLSGLDLRLHDDRLRADLALRIHELLVSAPGAGIRAT